MGFMLQAPGVRIRYYAGSCCISISYSQTRLKITAKISRPDFRPAGDDVHSLRTVSKLEIVRGFLPALVFANDFFTKLANCTIHDLTPKYNF